MYSEKKEVKVTSSLPHYMMATAASMAKQQPCVKKDEKKMEEKRKVATVPVR